MSTCEPRRGTVSRALATAILLCAQVASAPASAQSTAQDQATARALFNEARQLMKDGSYDRACTKLETASQLYAGSGVLLNLGDCYEHLGHTASAWTEFAEAASVAEREGRADDLAEARRRQVAIEAKLSRLAIRVPRETPGLVVKRDGATLVRGVWGEAVPADPGTHTVTAEAPGHVPWSGSVSLTEAGATVAIDVPELAMATETPAPPSTAAVTGRPPPTTAASAPAGDYWTGRREASAALTGLGAVGMGVGGAIVFVAKTQDNTARGETGAQRSTDSTSAVNLGNVATVVTSVGAAVAVCGLVLWLIAPSAPVQVGANGDGVLVRGRF
jgi:hypothetical protein